MRLSLSKNKWDYVFRKNWEFYPEIFDKLKTKYINFYWHLERVNEDRLTKRYEPSFKTENQNIKTNKVNGWGGEEIGGIQTGQR